VLKTRLRLFNRGGRRRSFILIDRARRGGRREGEGKKKRPLFPFRKLASERVVRKGRAESAKAAEKDLTCPITGVGRGEKKRDIHGKRGGGGASRAIHV